MLILVGWAVADFAVACLMRILQAISGIYRGGYYALGFGRKQLRMRLRDV
jgi:hypothetical protein